MIFVTKDNLTVHYNTELTLPEHTREELESIGYVYDVLPELDLSLVKTHNYELKHNEVYGLHYIYSPKPLTELQRIEALEKENEELSLTLNDVLTVVIPSLMG